MTFKALLATKESERISTNLDRELQGRSRLDGSCADLPFVSNDSGHRSFRNR
jgi:hypothetical protein